MINARDMHQTSTNRDGFLTPCPALGHLLNRAWTLLALSPRQWGTRDICWLAQITSLNGLKLSPWKMSRTWMLRNSFGKTLSHGSGSLVSPSRTMAFSLTANLSGDTVVTWKLRIGILPQLIPKGMDKSRLLTRS